MNVLPCYNIAGIESVKQYLNASNQLKSRNTKGFEFPFPEINKSCPVCRRAGCAKWHGYYYRNLMCVVLLYFDKVAIRRVYCSSTNKTSALIPDFIIPYRLISKISIIALLTNWFKSKSISNTVEKLFTEMDDHFQVGLSVIYECFYVVVTFLIMNSDKLSIPPPQSKRYIEVKPLESLSISDLDDFFFNDRFQWCKIISANKSPP